ncbi:MAG: cation:proton antiporter [Athalassotoga sp.]|uniref:cation:proton antiporter n=1 Tax=Athalassotoga sp. TaxID=2022597 RepID=UPI003CFD00A6
MIFLSHVDLIVLSLVVVMTLGFITFFLSKKVNISSIPILIVLGIIFGPVLGFIDRGNATTLFNYVRVIGLVIILFAEGHNLKWPLLKKHMATIGILDTIGLFVTAIVAGLFFSLFFHLPFLAGFLFGAIISATDPATLIPLFKQNKVNENIRTVIVTESIFNDPLGIVLTVLAVALAVPQASSAQFIEAIAKYTTLYPAAVIFFLYEIGISVVIGVILGIVGYWIARKLKIDTFPEIYALALAFGGFVIGEWAQASGYLVATTIGIVWGNHDIFFKKNGESKKFGDLMESELHFNEILSDFATVFIFILIGATVDLNVFGSALIMGSIVALIVVFVARPIAGLTLLPLRKWSAKEYLFISLEGPRGVVPSALAGLPLSLGIMYKNPVLTQWGEVILAATVITVLESVIIETLWVRPLSKRLLKDSIE